MTNDASVPGKTGSDQSVHFGQANKTGLFVAGGLAATTVGRFLILILAGIMLDSDDLGRFVLWQSAVAIAAEFGRWGIPRAALFLLNQSNNSATSDDSAFTRRDVISASLLPALAASALAALLLPFLLDTTIPGPVVAILTAAWVLGEALRLPASESFRAEGQVVEATILGDAGRIFLGLAFMLGAFAFSADLLIVVIAAAGASLLTGLAATRSALSRSATTPSSADTTRQIWRASGPLLVIGLIGVAQRHALVFVAASFLSLADTGTFALLLRASMLSAQVLHGLISFVSPAIARTELPTQAKELSRRLGTLTLRATGAAIAIGVGLLVVAPPTIRHLQGLQAANLVFLLAILCLGHIINVASGPGGQVLVLKGHDRVVRQIAAVGLIMLVSLAAISTWAYGLTGSVVAFSTVVAIRAVTTAGLCRQRTGVSPWLRLRSG